MNRKTVLIELDEETYNKFAYYAWSINRQIPEVIHAYLRADARKIHVDPEKYAKFDAV